MTISANVRKELFETTADEGKLIRIKPTEAKAGTTVYSSKQAQPLKMWTQEEHERFLEAMEKYPSGPWKVIAAFIGTKTTRQTMTHAQKYRQKIGRWRRGLRHKGRKHRGEGEGEGDGDADEGGDNDNAGKENLFRAIQFVSGDASGQQQGQSQTQTQAKQPENKDGKNAKGSQLFRLAELASIEVMKTSDEEDEKENAKPKTRGKGKGKAKAKGKAGTKGAATGKGDANAKGSNEEEDKSNGMLEDATSAMEVDDENNSGVANINANGNGSRTSNASVKEHTELEDNSTSVVL